MTRLFIPLLIALLPVTAFCRQISASQARSIAMEFFGTNTINEPDAKVAGFEQSAYYIFNNDTDERFVIVAGDDRMPAVLGYGDSSIGDSPLPPQLEDMLAYYADVYDSIDSYSIAQVAEYSPILLKTANWNQETPYNKYCPTRHTGCVATAMAIVMKYHNYPAQGKGSHDYRWNNSILSAVFDTYYDWDLMLDEYIKGQYTTEQADAVARLMFDCGVAVEMDYGEYGSSAPIEPSAFSQYFRYSKKIERIGSNNFSPSQWYDIINTELSNNRPIIYRGDDNTEGGTGHAFVVDGQDGQGRYHINWGWGGYCNGYFSLIMLNPTEDQNYSYNQYMLVNIIPEEDGEAEQLILNSRKGSSGINYNRERVVANDPFIVTLSALANNDTDAISGKVGIFLTDSDGNIKQELCRGTYNLPPDYLYYAFTFYTAKSQYDATPGDMLCCMYQPDNSTEWKPVMAGVGTSAKVSAYSFGPEYTTINWTVDPRLTVEPLNNHCLEYALRYAPYQFDIIRESGVEGYEVKVNGEILAENDGSYFRTPIMYEPTCDIEVTASPVQTDVDDVTADASSSYHIYNLQGIYIMTVDSATDFDEATRGLNPGVYIVRNADRAYKWLKK